MKKDLISKYNLDNKSRWSRVIVPIDMQDFEKLAIEVIKEDTGIDLTSKLSCDYDVETLSVRTIIDDESLTDEELDKLDGYSPEEWYLTTDYILGSLFGCHDASGLSIYVGSEEAENATGMEGNYTNYTCYMYIDANIYFSKVLDIKMDFKED